MNDRSFFPKCCCSEGGEVRWGNSAFHDSTTIVVVTVNLVVIIATIAIITRTVIILIIIVIGIEQVLQLSVRFSSRCYAGYSTSTSKCDMCVICTSKVDNILRKPKNPH